MHILRHTNSTCFFVLFLSQRDRGLSLFCALTVSFLSTTVFQNPFLTSHITIFVQNQRLDRRGMNNMSQLMKIFPSRKEQKMIRDTEQVSGLKHLILEGENCLFGQAHETPHTHIQLIYQQLIQKLSFCFNMVWKRIRATKGAF